MHVLITGGAGMIGRKLAERLARDGVVGPSPIERITLTDVVEPARPEPTETRIETVVSDLADPGVVEELVAGRPDLIFHLAAIVSSEAEADFDKGYRVNLDGTRLLLDAIRAVGGGYCPRVVFSSTIATFGMPLPEPIGDDQCQTPHTSYGTQKAICELLLADYTRRGFLDGIGLRLPTICVRPGAPNPAASGFFSAIIREPLAGLPAVLPVPDETLHWFASPRAAVGFLVHAATLEPGALGQRRSLTLPGVAATVADQIEALRRVGGDAAVRLIRREPDETIARIAAGWPRAFDTRRALELGFEAERDFDEIIRVYVDDELGGRVPLVEA